MDISLMLGHSKAPRPTFSGVQPDATSTGTADVVGMPVAKLRESPCVFILLSTYNGAAFLRPQLESLLTQSHTNWVLYWRDDGSSDATVAILIEFAVTIGPGRCIRVLGPSGRVFPAASYMAMVRAVLPALRPMDAIAFLDQDDLWLPAKLSRGVTALERETQGPPTLYCARLRVVDADLQCLTETRILPRRCGFPASLTQNIATGCTILLNRSAAELVARSVPPSCSMHDWWCYLLVTAAGGRIVVDDAVVALYRQHGYNFIGVQRSWLRRARAALHRGPSLFMNVLRQHLAALLAQQDLISETARPVVVQLQRALEGSLRQRVAVLRMRGLRRQNWSETVIFRLWFLIG